MGTKSFGDASAGSAFQVYTPGRFSNDQLLIRDYAVKAGDRIADQWMLADFPGNNYHLKTYGPNGFFREFKGNADDPLISISCQYEKDKLIPKKLSGNIILSVTNSDGRSLEIEITDNVYKSGKQNAKLGVNGSKNSKQLIPINLSKNYGWYDFTVRIKGNSVFEKRYAGRVETGGPVRPIRLWGG